MREAEGNVSGLLLFGIWLPAGRSEGLCINCCSRYFVYQTFVHLLSQVELVSSRPVLSAVGLRYERIVGV